VFDTCDVYTQYVAECVIYVTNTCSSVCLVYVTLQSNASQFYFPKWRNPYNVSYPEDILAMKTFTDQNKFRARRAMQLSENYCQETDQKSNKEAF
jgi:hypothetical protein